MKRAVGAGWFAALICAGPVCLQAQTPPSVPAASAPVLTPPSTAVRVVAGRVRLPAGARGDSTGMGPAANTWVTLHRVGKDSAGPVDSVRSDAAGRYRLTWRPFGAPDAVYFAAVKWGGIAYFTAPLRSAEAVADEAEITVFDTTSIPFPLSIKGRHLIVGAVDTTNTRTIIEVFELSNDSLRTLVSAARTPRPSTWSVVVPRIAADVRVTQGEVAPDAFAYDSGRVSIFAPIAPGLKQLAFTYRLPAESFPVNIRADDGAVVFEVLVEEEQGTVRGAGFTAVEPVTIENRKFRRFLAQDVKRGGVVTLELPVTTSRGRLSYGAALLVAFGFVMLLVLSRVVQQRTTRHRPGATTPATLRETARAYAQSSAPPVHERLAQEIAALDATFAKLPAPSDTVREAYEARRKELKAALADALASAGTGG